MKKRQSTKTDIPVNMVAHPTHMNPNAVWGGFNDSPSDSAYDSHCSDIMESSFAEDDWSQSQSCLRSDSMDSDCDETFITEEWYVRLDKTTTENALETAIYFHKLVAEHKDAIQHECSHEELSKAVVKLDKRDEIMRFNTSFIREGDLSKLNRAGRQIFYKFFLLSDCLLYTHQGMTGGYKVHEMLNLWEMKAKDREVDPTRCSIAIVHPSKSFIIVADNVDLKYSWLADIQNAISNCIFRRSNIMSKTTVIAKLEEQNELMRKLHKAIVTGASKDTARLAAQINSETLARTNSPLVQSSDRLRRSKVGNAGGSSSVFKGNGNMITQSPAPQPLSGMDSITENTTTTPIVKGTRPSKDPPPSEVIVDPELERQKKEEVLLARKENLRKMADEMDSSELSKLFENGSIFWENMLDSRSGNNNNTEKLVLYGYYKQAKNGPAPTSYSAATPAPSSPIRGSTSDGNLADAIVAQTERNESNSLLSPKAARSNLKNAWAACGNMSSEEAKRKFLVALLDHAPYWKYENYL